MYLLTQEMPEVAAHVAKTGHEMPMALDFGGEIYIRQEGGAMLLGTYEQACVPWSPRETPWDFGSQLLKPDLDRITPELSVAFKHYPAMGTIGIRKVVNGPFTFSPDGNPLVGPIRGLRGYWVACGVMAGLSQGGGVGLALATWMTAGDHGDSGMDIWAMDVARYGDYATLAYTNAKVQENYRRRFRITFPNEELPAARPLLTTPIHDRLDGGERRLGRDVRSRARALVPARRARAARGRDLPPLERLGLRRRGGRRRPRTGRHDRDLELRQVPGQRTGRRGVAVLAADRSGCRRRADHADGDAQRRGQDRRRVHGRAGVGGATSSTCSDRCRPRSTTRAGSVPICRPTGASGSRFSGSG